MGNVTNDIMTDAESVRRIIGTINKTTPEFREAEMKTKLKECQAIRTRSYQHQEYYIEGYKVWYQYKDGLA